MALGAGHILGGRIRIFANAGVPYLLSCKQSVLIAPLTVQAGLIQVRRTPQSDRTLTNKKFYLEMNERSGEQGGQISCRKAVGQ
jgi:hypothetical protein